MLNNIKKLCSSCSALLSKGKEAYLSGLFQIVQIQNGFYDIPVPRRQQRCDVTSSSLLPGRWSEQATSALYYQITKESSAVSKPVSYGWNHVLFEHGSDGSWRKDNITIVADKSSYKVFIEWNKGKGEKKATEAKGDYIVCYVPDLWALLELIKLFYPNKIPKFTSLVGDATYTH